jgi:hypothetical protein
MVVHDTGAHRGGRSLVTKGARVATPWGALPLGGLAFMLATPHGSHTIDLRELDQVIVTP